LRRIEVAALGLGVGLAVGRTALADNVPSLDFRTWSPAADPRAGLVTEPASTPGSSFALSAWTHFENDPITLRNPDGSVSVRPVDDLLGLDLVASLGIGSHGLLAFRVPFYLDEQGTGSVSTQFLTSGTVPAQSVGDMALLGKVSFLSNDAGGLGLAALGEVTFPTGPGTSFMSEAGVTGTLRILADMSFRVASVQGSLGYTVRTSQQQWPTIPLAATFGDSIPWTLGVIVHPSKLHVLDPEARQTWEVALHGSLPGGPVAPFGLGAPGAAEQSPALLSFSDRVGLGHYRDGFLLLGVDVGLSDAVGVPSFRAVMGLGVRFGGHDKDNDGTPDDVDRCPTLAEDRDGFEDADGCPEADNDNDGVVDAEDACPNVPGERSPDPRKNGCPATGKGEATRP
jgi:hypothetical protein